MNQPMATSRSGIVPHMAPHMAAFFPTLAPKIASPIAAPNTICVKESIFQNYTIDHIHDHLASILFLSANIFMLFYNIL